MTLRFMLGGAREVKRGRERSSKFGLAGDERGRGKISMVKDKGGWRDLGNGGREQAIRKKGAFTRVGRRRR